MNHLTSTFQFAVHRRGRYFVLAFTSIRVVLTFCSYPTAVDFMALGDFYLQGEDTAQALKYFSLGLHADPHNYDLRGRIDSIRKSKGKRALSMCKWRGNIFTQTHEVSTSLGMVHAVANRIEASLVFFHASVGQCKIPVRKMQFQHLRASFSLFLISTPSR